MEHSKPGVYNEWDTLGRVIVGRTDDFMFPEFDWVFENYQGISEEVKQGLRNSAGKTYREVDPDGYELTRAEQDNLASIMESNGVEVVRPTRASDEQRAACAVGYTAMFERDNTFAVADEIINCFCRTRARRKNHPSLFDEISRIAAETQQIHISQPVPSMTTALEDESQPYLEGGDLFILGQDILVGHAGIATSYAGIDWLRQHLEPKGYRVHTVELSNDFIHLDCVFMTPRPGLAVICWDGLVEGKSALPDFMHDWTYLEATQHEAEAMGCNGVNLAPNKTVIGEEHTRIIDLLEAAGVDLVKIPYANASAFGGGPRCSTHPLLRS